MWFGKMAKRRPELDDYSVLDPEFGLYLDLAAVQKDIDEHKLTKEQAEDLINQAREADYAIFGVLGTE